MDSSLVELGECVLFQEESQNLRDKIKEENVGFLRVLKDMEEDCLDDIYTLLEKRSGFNHSVSDISMN